MDFAGKDLFSESRLAGIENILGLGQLPQPHTTGKDGGLRLSGPMDDSLPSVDSPSVHFLMEQSSSCSMMVFIFY